MLAIAGLNFGTNKTRHQPDTRKIDPRNPRALTIAEGIQIGPMVPRTISLIEIARTVTPVTVANKWGTNPTWPAARPQNKPGQQGGQR